jgi:hypothetical protein
MLDSTITTGIMLQLSDLAPIAGIHMPQILEQGQSIPETLPLIQLLTKGSDMDIHTKPFSEIMMVL